MYVQHSFHTSLPLHFSFTFHALNAHPSFVLLSFLFSLFFFFFFVSFFLSRFFETMFLGKRNDLQRWSYHPQAARHRPPGRQDAGRHCPGSGCRGWRWNDLRRFARRRNLEGDPTVCRGWGGGVDHPKGVEDGLSARKPWVSLF